MTSKKNVQASLTKDYNHAAEALRDFYIRSHRALDRLMSGQGATIAKFKIMSFIKRGGKVRSTDLAQAFGFAPRTITEAVDSLEREGLVERITDTVDRRVKYISLTTTGEKVLCASEPVRKDFGDRLFEVLSEEEIARLAQLLGRLNERLLELEADHSGDSTSQ